MKFLAEIESKDKSAKLYISIDDIDYVTLTLRSDESICSSQVDLRELKTVVDALLQTVIATNGLKGDPAKNPFPLPEETRANGGLRKTF